MSPPPPPSSSSSSGTSFPILAISILGILTTAILLVSYYVFVIKCCFNWHRVDILTRLATSRRRRRLDDHPSSSPFTFYAAETRGLEENVIRAIPIIRFRKGTDDDVADRKKCSTFFFHECAVCLTEFADGESVRLLPNCSHAFHIDCIDTWLQTNSNCPLCRSEISSPIPSEHFIAHFPIHDVVDSVVIDVGDDGVGGCTTTGQDPTGEPKSPPVQNRSTPSPRKKQQVPEQRWPQKKGRKLQHLTSMGDECISVRSNDERFSSVQPIRRSISMDSSTDRKLYISVQEILRQQQSLQLQQEASAVAAIGEGSSGGAGGGSGPHRRAFFYFGHSSRIAVAPIQFVT